MDLRASTSIIPHAECILTTSWLFICLYGHSPTIVDSVPLIVKNLNALWQYKKRGARITTIKSPKKKGERCGRAWVGNKTKGLQTCYKTCVQKILLTVSDLLAKLVTAFGNKSKNKNGMNTTDHITNLTGEIMQACLMESPANKHARIIMLAKNIIFVVQKGNFEMCMHLFLAKLSWHAWHLRPSRPHLDSSMFLIFVLRTPYRHRH